MKTIDNQAISDEEADLYCKFFKMTWGEIVSKPITYWQDRILQAEVLRRITDAELKKSQLELAELRGEVKV